MRIAVTGTSLVLAMSLLLGACGQTGRLYRPGDEAPRSENRVEAPVPPGRNANANAEDMPTEDTADNSIKSPVTSETP